LVVLAWPSAACLAVVEGFLVGEGGVLVWGIGEVGSVHD